MLDHVDNVIDLNAILHPGSVYDHPRDVIADATLSIGEKRAILASWASDAASVDSGIAGAARLEPGRHHRRNSGSARARPRSEGASGGKAGPTISVERTGLAA